MNNTGIYKIINLINNKIYIGSAKNLNNRCKSHFTCLRNNKHCNEYLQLSFNKYKEESFRFEVLEYCEIKKLVEREQYYIDTLKPEYNICKIAYSRLGTTHSEEVKRKIGLKSVGRNEAISKGHLGKKKDRYTIEQMIKSRIKPILQFDKEDNLIKEWSSIKEVSETLNIKHSCISNCLRGFYKTSGKFKWKYKNNN